MLSDFLKDYLSIIIFLFIALGLSCAFVVVNPKTIKPNKQMILNLDNIMCFLVYFATTFTKIKMNSSLPYKTKQFFFVLIKLSIVVGAFYFIYQKLLNNPNLKFEDFLVFLDKNELFSTKNIIILLVLSVFNWFLEITKW